MARPPVPQYTVDPPTRSRVPCNNVTRTRVVQNSEPGSQLSEAVCVLYFTYALLLRATCVWSAIDGPHCFQRDYIRAVSIQSHTQLHAHLPYAQPAAIQLSIDQRFLTIRNSDHVLIAFLLQASPSWCKRCKTGAPQSRWCQEASGKLSNPSPTL